MTFERPAPEPDPAQPKLAESQRDPLDELAEEFITRCRAGERPTIAEYAGRRPELAARIAALFPTLLELESLGASSAEGGRGAAAAPPEVIGDFRILREVGRGGMGTVYEAEQVSLGRRVALKVMHVARLGGEKVLERFRREARAAARLHHSNIVPVYGTGEVEGAVYYAMQFIDGRDLSEILEEVRRQKEAIAAGEPDPRALSDSAVQLTGSTSGSSPSAAAEGHGHYVRRVAAIARQAAEALAYAHGEGVLHRDIKPANLLLDAKGTLWVTDFGLAKAEGSTQLTQSGDVVGTVAYLAPERLEGWCDARSDVYALGLTLYELLTLRRAFPQPTRAEALQAIARHDPPKPRALDPTIPRDLETIVLKAIDKHPADRYGSARELAADLERFLEIRPIHARRSGAAGRLRRWCQRNPLTAGFAAASAVLLLAFAITATVAAVRLRRERDAARSAEGRADERMRDARIAAARLRRQTGVPGQRAESLRELAEAAAVRSDPAVLTEAIAALGLFDLEREREHPLLARTIAFSPAFQTYATELESGEVALRDAADSTVLRAFAAEGAAKRVDDLRFSPTGRLLAIGSPAAGSGYLLRIVRADDGRERLRRAAPGRGLGCDFAPDEASVALRGGKGGIEIVPLGEGGAPRSLEIPPGWRETTLVRFHPSGRWLAGLSVWNSTSGVIWDVESARVDAVLTFPSFPLSIAWHPREKALAAGGSDFSAYLYDVDSGQRLVEYQGHEAEVVELTFHPDGRTLATSAWGNQTRFWDTWTGQIRLRADGRFMGWDDSGARVALASGRRTLGLWRVAEGSEVRSVAFESGDKGVRRLAVSPEGDLVAAAVEAHGLQVALASGGPAEILSPERSMDVAFLSSGRGLLSSGARLLFFPLERSGTTARFLSPQVLAERGEHFSLSSDDRSVALLSRDNRLQVLDLEDGRPARSIGSGRGATGLSVSRGARWIALSRASEGGARVLLGESGETLLEIGSPRAFLQFSPDDRGLVVVTLETTQLLESGSWRPLWSRPNTSGAMGSAQVSFPRDRRFFLCSTGENDLVLQELATGREIARLGSGIAGVLGAQAVGGSGTVTIGYARGRVEVWNLSAIRRGLRVLGLDPQIEVDGAVLGPSAERIELSGPKSGKEAVLRRRRLAASTAGASLSALIQGNPESAELFEARAEAHARAGQLFDAALDLERALRLRPKDPARASLQRAQHLEKLQSYEACLAEADRCLSYSPGMVAAISLRGVALKNLVRIPEAILAFEAVMKLSPFNTQAAGELAWLLSIGPEATRAPERALSLARLAVLASPKSQFALRAQALAAYRAGADDEARGAARRILSLPDAKRSLTARLVLALAEARSGDRGAAQRALEEARALRRDTVPAPHDVGAIDALLAEAEAAVK